MQRFGLYILNNITFLVFLYISVYICLKEMSPVNVHLPAALYSYQEHDPCIQMTDV